METPVVAASPRAYNTQMPAKTRTARSASVALPSGRLVHLRLWPGHGTPIVVLHGLLDSSDGWTDVCRDVPNPCVAVDLPGFGRSDLPARPRVSAYAEDVAYALELLGVRRFVLLGHSFGGAVATAVAELLPARVAELVLLAPAGFGRNRLAEAVVLPGVRGVVERLLPRTRRHRAAVAAAYTLTHANMDAVDAAMMEAVTRTVGRLSNRGFHRRRVAYRGPVTVVWGSRDRVVPASHLGGVTTAFPHVRPLIWDGMGHHPQRERRPELLSLVCRSCQDGATVTRPAPLRVAPSAVTA